MSCTIPQPVPTDCRKYAKSLIEFNNLNTFNNVDYHPYNPIDLMPQELPDMKDLTPEEQEQLCYTHAFYGCATYAVAFVLAIILCALFGSCAAPKAIDRTEHHHAAIDTAALHSAVDARIQSVTARLDSLFRERTLSSSAERYLRSDQKELITETVTTTTDSLGRSIRQEQRTISRDLHQELQQLTLRIEREMESRLQLALALHDSIWQQRLDAALSHREQTDSTHNTVTPVAQDTRPWYRRWADRLQWFAIGIVLAAALWITRTWWRKFVARI